VADYEQHVSLLHQVAYQYRRYSKFRGNSPDEAIAAAALHLPASKDQSIDYARWLLDEHRRIQAIIDAERAMIASGSQSIA
jgi:hypothetical protein